MRSTSVLLLLSFFALAAGPNQTQSANSAKTMDVFVSVSDEQDRLVDGLTEDDFQVSVNGKPEAVITFDRNPHPLSVAVMLDGSGTMKNVFDVARRAADDFLAQVQPADHVAVCSFDKRTTCYPDAGLTTDVGALRRSLGQLQPGFPCALYDAIGQGIERVSNADGRRAVVVLDDGEDNVSKSTVQAVNNKAIVSDVVLFAIGVEHEYLDVGGAINMATGEQRTHSGTSRTRPDPGLKHLARETGGKFCIVET